jgi:hypothetical protein
MGGTISLDDATVQMALVAALVAALRFPVSKLVPADWQAWALLALSTLLQAALTFAIQLTHLSGPVTWQAIVNALWTTVLLVAATHGVVDLANRGKAAATASSTAPVVTETQNGLPLQMGG